MRRVRKSMRLNTRTVVLFSTLVVLFIGLMGCFPQPRPDTTPPVVDEVLVSQINPNPVEKGLPVDVTVKVTATDQRSNLKHTEIMLFAKLADAPDTAYQPVENGTAVVAFPAQRSATAQHQFTVPTNAAPFDAAGSFVFQARATAEDIRGNKSAEAVRSAASGFVVNPSRDPQLPVIHELSVSPGTSGDERITVPANEPVRFSVRATDADGDLQELKLEIQTSTTESTVVTVTDQGASELTALIPALTLRLEGNETSAVFIATATAKDEFHPDPVEKRFFITAYRQGVMLVEETHLDVSSTTRPGLPQMQWGRYAGTAADKTAIQSDPLYNDPATYELPFGITTLKFNFNVSDIPPDARVDLYIYSRPTDLFNEGEQFLRGWSQISGQNETSIRFANLSMDDGKWLAIRVHGVSNPWFVWKIRAADHVTTPAVNLEYRGTIEEFIEGKPIVVHVELRDEMLLTLDDFRIRFERDRGIGGGKEWISMEEIFHLLNLQHVGAGAADTNLRWNPNWRYAIRYHVKATFNEFDVENDPVRRRDMEPDPDPKIVYAISRPHTGIQSDPFGTGPIHQWYRFDGTTDRVAPNTTTDASRLWNLTEPTDFIYFFGIPDRQVEQYNKPLYITEHATMEIQIYAEIVVVDQNNLDEVLFVADASLGAANRFILETAGGYKQYDLAFAARNAKHNWGTSDTKIFPIYADNTSPQITVTYGPEPLKKVFADRRPHELQSIPGAFDRIAVPMFFADNIVVSAGERVTFTAKDNVALYDFVVLHTGDHPFQDSINWRNDLNLPPMLNPNHAIDIPMGFDFLFHGVYHTDWGTNTFYEGRSAAPFAPEDKPLRTLNEIFPDLNQRIISKSIYTNIYSQPFGRYMIDPKFEYYENFTWSNVRNANRASISTSLQERYFGMRVEEVTHEVTMPSIPGTYWVWAIARDRGAQDSYLFDYNNDDVNIDPLTGLPSVYQWQNLRFNQNNRFVNALNLDDPRIYFDNSRSEADAAMVVLLRVRVRDHSMNIQRLDIHEPNLVSYPTVNWTCEDGNLWPEVWYAHSYNVLEIPRFIKVAEFSENEPRALLPFDMYPVYKRVYDEAGIPLDYDQGNRFGIVQDGNPHPYNLWRAVETYRYGGVDRDPSNPLNNEGFTDLTYTYEAIPVVGGPGPDNTTKFRFKTHEDIKRVELFLVPGEFWTVIQYANQKPVPIASKSITVDDNATKFDGQGVGGYWQWDINWYELGLMGIEQTHTLIIKAYKPADSTFHEQWQWPIYVDTKGPRIQMYNTEPGTVTDSLLNILDKIPEGLNQFNAHHVQQWVAMLVKDDGGIFFEHEKGFREWTTPPVTYTYPTNPWPAIPTNWQYRMQDSRSWDLDAHELFIKAGDTSDYLEYDGQDLRRIDLNGHFLGFPGIGIESDAVLPPFNLQNSLKYLNDRVNTVEFLQRPAILNMRNRNFMQELYSGHLDHDHYGSLPTRALFHNIDFDRYIWRDEGENKLFLRVQVRDELGNLGEWESYIRKMGDPMEILANVSKNLNSITLDATDCRLNEITLDATSTDMSQRFNFLDIREILPPTITSTIPGTRVDVDPTSPFIAGEIVHGILAPAFYPFKTIHIDATYINNTRAATQLTIPATYSGSKPVLKVEPNSNDINQGVIVDIREKLDGMGRPELRNLLFSYERYVIAGFTGNETVLDPLVVHADFTSFDDNVDRYLIQYFVDHFAATRTTTGHASVTYRNATLIDANAQGTVTNLFWTTLTRDATYGYISFSATSTDCPGLDQVSHTAMKLWYQNPDPRVFVLSVSPFTLAPEAWPRFIDVALQSDILYKNAADLHGSFEFYKDGHRLETKNVWTIPSVGAAQTTATAVGAEPGRNRIFRFEVDTFAPGMAARISGSSNGIDWVFKNLFSVAGGFIERIEIDNPAMPKNLKAEVTPTGLRLTWDRVTDPKGGLVTYDVYFWEQETTQRRVSRDQSAHSYTVPFGDKAWEFDPGKNYHWMIVAKNNRGGITASELRTFSTGPVPPPGPFSKISPLNNPIDPPVSTELSWTPSSHATAYDVYIGPAPNDLVKVATVPAPGTSFSPPDLQSDTLYYWNIDARNAQGAVWADGGTPWSFRTQEVGLIYLEKLPNGFAVKTTKPFVASDNILLFTFDFGGIRFIDTLSITPNNGENDFNDQNPKLVGGTIIFENNDPKLSSPIEGDRADGVLFTVDVVPGQTGTITLLKEPMVNGTVPLERHPDPAMHTVSFP